MNRPTPVTRADVAGLAGLIGATLTAVTYHYLLPAEGRSYAGGEAGVDGDLAAIVLDLGDRGCMALTWAMLGELEGLALLAPGMPYSGKADQTVDASDREAWGIHRGETITSVGAAWQVSGDDDLESLWAVRLGFAGGSIVIALGTADPDLDYVPDELVVVFDESLARAYRPRHVSENSWGHAVEPA